ncbi:MAG: transcriptional regulator [Acidiferrobacteraceae bacterium]|nr:transcriptional regulator [Acidiferrobacteraceae bacterium]
MKPPFVLIVDDEPDICRVVGEILRDEGFEIDTAENAEIARSKYSARTPDLVLLDIWMPDTDGVTLLKEWKVTENAPPIVMISGHGTVETAVESVRAGAYDFLEKPLSTAKMLVTVERALEARNLKDENLLLRNRLAPSSTLIGKSITIENLRKQVKLLAINSDQILVLGESGSGKSVVTRALHRASSRESAVFHELKIISIATNAVAQRLFGQEKGGRTTAGALEEAGDGTLVIDEIGYLNLEIQKILFEALINRYFYTKTSAAPIALRARVIATSSEDLKQKVVTGTFRDDLYQYFAKNSINVPPLEEHQEDIPELVDYYTKITIESEHLPFRKFSTAAINLIRNQKWPDNVRGLRNAIQQLLLTAKDEEIDAEEVQILMHSTNQITSTNSKIEIVDSYDQPLRKAREQFERAYFSYHLSCAGGNMTELANRTGMERTHLYRKLKSLDINPKLAKEKTDRNA